MSLVRLLLVCLGLSWGGSTWACPELVVLGLFAKRTTVDRLGYPIGGRIRWSEHAVWWDSEWNEPILLASGNPLRLNEGVELEEGLVRLRYFEVDGTNR